MGVVLDQAVAAYWVAQAYRDEGDNIAYNVAMAKFQRHFQNMNMLPNKNSHFEEFCHRINMPSLLGK